MELKPCPFCGKGETSYREKKIWTGMSSKITSVSIYHWCEQEEGQPNNFLEIKGKTKEDVIRRWNNRE